MPLFQRVVQSLLGQPRARAGGGPISAVAEPARDVVAKPAAPPIDFRDIAGKFSFQEHASRADRYFATLSPDSIVARKPFASSLEAVELSSGVAAILSGLHLFRGARVLDFGAGTCWLSRILALLDCVVTAADVSAKALGVGKELLDRDALARHLQVTYTVLDDERLPFPDGSFDRVVCFDALHHCRNQQATITEFFRVLADDGIAAFHEPGPHHSQASQSQFEMRSFDVIEGDIVVEELIDAGRRAGFSAAELALYAARPAVVNLADFNAFLAAPERAEAGQKLLHIAAREHDNRRVFFLHKGDPIGRLDSRSPVGLLAELSLSAQATEAGVLVRGTAANIGAAAWLPSMRGPSSVNLGMHLYDASGSLIDNDYFRAPLCDVTVPHGKACAFECIVPWPQGQRQFRLIVDLVAEGITWFEIGQSRVVVIDVDRELGRAVSSSDTESAR